ncbi:monocarboxylate transporter 12-B-like [Amphiura filiformis]|uniref:monocarboxylate transporter 12-B-like n=1 Tax=Amphiura filiformis TaxID=82378 RepID=UPI003B21158F
MAPSTTHPVDHGYAWVVLASCCVMRAFNDGFWASLGIFFIKWEVYFGASATKTSLIGSLYMLVLFTMAPVSSALARRLTHRVVVIASGILTVICCFATSFITEFWHLFIAMTLLSFALGMSFQVAHSGFNTYFDKHLTSAYMLNHASSGLGIFIVPPLMELLISNYGWKGAFQITSAIMANICVCGLMLRMPPQELKDKETDDLRIKPLDDAKDGDKTNCDMLRKYMPLLCNIRFLFQVGLVSVLNAGCVTAIIYFVPYASDVGLSDLKCSILMLVFGASITVARFVPIGWKVNISASTIGGVAYLLSGLSLITFAFMWTLNQLMVVAVVFGASYGLGYSMMMNIVSYPAGLKEKASWGVAFLPLNGIGIAAYVFIGGVLFDITGSYKSSLLLCGVSTLCVALIVFFYSGLIRWQHCRRTDQSQICSNIQYLTLLNDVSVTNV